MSVSGVTLSKALRSCELVEEDGSVIGTYPYIWLRDNCQCSQCSHPTLHARIILMENLDPEIIPAKAEVNVAEQVLHIQWPDNHTSQFSFSWLLKHQFPNIPADPVSTPSRQYWGAEMLKRIPTFMFQDIQTSDKSLHDWLESLQIYGIALIRDAPKEEGIVKAIGKRVSFVTRTVYG